MSFQMIDSNWPEVSYTLMFAQNDGPGLPDESGGGGGEAGQLQDGSGGQGGANAQPSLFNPLTLMMLILIPIILFSMLGGRKQKKQREQMLSSMKKHDHVQTIGGVIGSIVSINNDHIVLKVDESTNTRIKFARSAVSQVLPDGRKSAGQEVTPIEPPTN